VNGDLFSSGAYGYVIMRFDEAKNALYIVKKSDVSSTAGEL